MTSQVYFTRHDGGLTFMRDGKQSVVSSDNPNFKQILVALKDKAYDKLETLMSIAKTINATGVARAEGRKVFVKDGKVFYVDSKRKTRELHGALVQRIVEALRSPTTVHYADSLMVFLDNIQKNKLKDIREELYQFLMSGAAPITTDGCFLAYKKIKNNYMDVHSGKIDNHPGNICKMPQDQVDTNRHEHCSTGLHFASRGYMSVFSGDRTVIVKINPKHVFAIPTDYSYQKGRCSEYYVVGEFKGDTNTEEAFKNSFIDEDTKTVVSPKVEFHQDGLRPSLENSAKSYGILKDGKVLVLECDDGYRVVAKHTDGKYYDCYGTGHPEHQIVERSFATKSVREAVKFAVEYLNDE